MKVQVKVNERGALRNGRFAFTNKLTLVSELLQNARRAGATLVTITYDANAKRLTVIDDGCGIEDFQRLLTFNESGWDKDTVRNEHAFGLGFSKCLYAAEHVTVTSRGQRLAFQCEMALDQAELHVEPAPGANPLLTTVELEGVELLQLDAMIDRITRGFPIPVVYNGVPQPRLHRQTAMTFTATDIGQVHLWGMEGGEPATTSALYLQGLQVGSADREHYWEHQRIDVIHLDPTLFMARMPDRTELIDAQEQGQRIDSAVKQLWRKLLDDKKQQLPPAEFVECFYDIAQRQNLLEVFDDVPVLPRQACSRVIDYPTKVAEEDQYLQRPQSHATRAEVDSETCRLAGFDPYVDDESHATLLYAQAAGLTLVHPYRLNFEHWALRKLRDLNTEDIAVVAVGPQTEFRFDGSCICQQVRLCDHIEIRHGRDVVKITDEALFHDDVILFPAGCREGAVVKQVSAYTDDYGHFDETGCEEDMRRLERLVRTLRCPDPASMLHSLLQDLPLKDYAALVGRTFRVAIGSSGDEASVDLVMT